MENADNLTLAQQAIEADKREREQKAMNRVRQVLEECKVNLLPTVQIIGTEIKADIIFMAI